jgi:FAD/FMN-containing dehydrogenase
MKEGGMFKYDLSVPLPSLYKLVEEMQQHLSSLNMLAGTNSPVNKDNHATAVLGFGHAGDCNLHLNIMTTGITPILQNAIEPFIYERTKYYGGSISAEHGLGVMKRNFLKYSQTEDNITLMRTIKDLFDPNGIMNPGKYLPDR